MRIDDIKKYTFFRDKELIKLKVLENQGYSNIIYLLESETLVPNKTRLKPSVPTEKKTEKYLIRKFQIALNRKVEFKIQKQAFAKNIGAKPILLDEQKGLMITEFMEGRHKTKLSNQELKKIALLLKKLHKIKVRQKQNNFKENFSFKNKKAKKAFIALDKEPKEYALGHNDLHPKNIIFLGRSIKLIDWEYARYNDIYFDLASIIVEYKLNKQDKKSFLHSYFRQKRVNYKKLELFTVIYKELFKLWFEKLKMGKL